MATCRSSLIGFQPGTPSSLAIWRTPNIFLWSSTSCYLNTHNISSIPRSSRLFCPKVGCSQLPGLMRHKAYIYYICADFWEKWEKCRSQRAFFYSTINIILAYYDIHDDDDNDVQTRCLTTRIICLLAPTTT
jgi:hypothetical protein